MNIKNTFYATLFLVMITYSTAFSKGHNMNNQMISIGDYVTVVEDKENNSEGLKKSVLKILSIDKNLILVKWIMKNCGHSQEYKYILNTDVITFRKLSDDFVQAYIGDECNDQEEG